MKDFEKPCGFSIDLVSKEFLDIVSLSNKNYKGVLVEGSLGELLGIEFLDGSVLVIKCNNGVLRIDLNLHVLQSAIKENKYIK